MTFSVKSYIKQVISLSQYKRKKEAVLEDLEAFSSRVEAKAILQFNKEEGESLTKSELKQVLNQTLRARDYMPYEEIAHANLVANLKKEGKLKQVYKRGGSVAFEKGRFVSQQDTRNIGGKEYISKGYYELGGVKVQYFTKVDGNSRDNQYIEIGGTLYERKGGYRQ